MKNNRSRRNDRSSFPGWFLFPKGIGLGTGLGALLGNVGVGTAIGVALGTTGSLVMYYIKGSE
ncbi:MAG: hypothetical protein WBB69_07005 [Anaerolineales bacterium]